MTYSDAYIEEMKELEDFAHFRVELSPKSFTLEELKVIVDDMTRCKVVMENRMREDFAKRSEVEQTILFDTLGNSGYGGGDWWCCMLMDDPVHRYHPAF